MLLGDVGLPPCPTSGLRPRRNVAAAARLDRIVSVDVVDDGVYFGRRMLGMWERVQSLAAPCLSVMAAIKAARPCLRRCLAASIARRRVEQAEDWGCMTS
jgi:hypothetical protein